MRTQFTYGPSVDDDSEFEIGPYFLKKEEALRVADLIYSHFNRPRFDRIKELEQFDKPKVIVSEPTN